MILNINFTISDLQAGFIIGVCVGILIGVSYTMILTWLYKKHE